MPADRLALLAFAGGLPGQVLAANSGAHVVTFAGTECRLAPTSGQAQRFEALGALVAELRAAGVGRLVFAGALDRPVLDPAQMDGATRTLAPRLAQASARGDDHLLRTVAGFFEAEGFQIVGPQQVTPDLTAPPGPVAGPMPDAAARADAGHAAAILEALASFDLGQGAVVAGGLCLGLETLGGTDALLAQVAALPAERRPGAAGVLVKQPKRGQDLRLDLPAIGPATVHAAARAGLGGIVIAADTVLLVDRPGTLAACAETGLFLYARGA